MAIHDYILDNANGVNFRADLNSVLSAIVSNNSNATEPTTTYAFMWWADTNTSLLKQRNSSNLAWVDILNFTTGASVATSINDLIDAITDGLKNMAIGEDALNSITTGYNNLAIGEDALNSITTGYQNIGIGVRALNDNITGYRNVVVGQSALDSNISGHDNVAVGRGAGAGATVYDYAITLGGNTVPLGTNYITMGKNGGTDRVYNNFAANATWTRVSDKRIKKDIETNNHLGLAFINSLRTVTYNFKAPSELDASMSEYDKDIQEPSYDKRMYGFIAQEVKQAMDKNNITDFAGWHIDENGKDKLQGISYEMFIMPLVKAVQELSIKNFELSTRLSNTEIFVGELIEDRKKAVIENQGLSDKIDGLTKRLEKIGG